MGGDPPSIDIDNQGKHMFFWAIVFFIVAIVGAIFGFGGIAHESAYIGKILAVVGLALAVASFAFCRRTRI